MLNLCSTYAQFQIVKKVDNQSEVEFNPSSLQSQPIYSDQNQLINYPPSTGNASQQLYSTEPYEQLQSAYSLSGTEYTNYYQPTAQPNYVYAQTSAAEFQSNYDSNQLSNLPPLLDLNQQQQLYQPTYSNYVQQQTPSYYDQQHWQQSTALSQQITPLSATYQPQQFSFNQYAQDNQLINIPFNQQQSTSQHFVPQIGNQISIGNQLGNQLSAQLNESDQAAANQYSQQHHPNLAQQFSQPLNTTAIKSVQSTSIQQQPHNVSNQNIQNLQNIPPGQSKSQQQQQPSKPVITSAAHGTIAPPLLNKIKQKMASHGSKVMTMIKASPTSDQKPPNGSTTASNLDASRKSSFCPSIQNQSSLNTEELTAHLTDEEKQILAKVFQKEEEFQRETR